MRSQPLAWVSAPLHLHTQHIALPGLPAQERPLIQCWSCRYMADEARSLKAYGELPDSSKCLQSLHNGCKAVCERSQVTDCAMQESLWACSLLTSLFYGCSSCQ